jgi:hypothetical protein
VPAERRPVLHHPYEEIFVTLQCGATIEVGAGRVVVASAGVPTDSSTPG